MMDQIYNIATTVTIPDIELTFEGIVTLLFNICCGILYLIGEATGMGYELEKAEKLCQFQLMI